MAGLTPQSVTLTAQFCWFEGGARALVLFPQTRQYIDMSSVELRELHAQLTNFIQQGVPKAVAP
jgi:hypothetical protein